MNYKMDLSETMKKFQGKEFQSSSHQSQESQGYITEKMYMLLQLYLQNNKGWNPSLELLQAFSELKDSVLSNPAYLQVLASRIALDSQGRLVLRDSGKIILPYEHFSNAVMLKHISGPHGLHLSLEATVRSVMESYTIGRDNFGMEKEFIVDVVQSCPNSACRYYKGHMGSFMDQNYSSSQINSDYLNHLQQLGGVAGANPGAMGDITGLNYDKSVSSLAQAAVNNISKLSKTNQQALQQQQQQQITAAIIQQQNRAIAQQSLEKFGNLTPMEKQRILQQLDKKHYETVAAVAQANNLAAAQSSMMNQNLTNQLGSSSTNHSISQLTQHHSTPQPTPPAIHHHSSATPQPQPIPIPQPIDNSHKTNDFTRAMYDGGIETYSAAHYSTSNRELLALHNGAWLNSTNSTTNNSNSSSSTELRDGMIVGQDKIIRAFAELMRNMARMKTFIRPSMVKPYGKQSECLQKTLVDTIQLVQSLRNCLPPPHISVGNWKSEDRLRKEAEEQQQQQQQQQLNLNRPMQ